VELIPSRSIAVLGRTATGNSYGNQFAHYTETGVSLRYGGTWLQPFTGVQYIYLGQRGFGETGAGSVDLTTGNQNVNSVRSNFGARIYQEVTWFGVRFVPTASARYQREWADGTQLLSSSFAGAPTTSFATGGTSLGRNFGLFTLGATTLLTDNASLYGAIDTQIAAHYNAVIGSGGFQYQW
jgi:outer membrane autotransporter protein